MAASAVCTMAVDNRIVIDRLWFTFRLFLSLHFMQHVFITRHLPFAFLILFILLGRFRKRFFSSFHLARYHFDFREIGRI